MSRLSIWTMSSASDPSTPTLPATPSTPPQSSPRDGNDQSTPMAHESSPMKMRLPNPSSFSLRIPSAPTSPEQQDDPRSPDPRTRPTSLYTIPQKTIPAFDNAAHIRRGPPSALTLQPLRMPLGPGSSLSPFSRSTPVSAPLSKVATIGAARRLSESQKNGPPPLQGGASMSRSKSTSIWAEGLPSPRTSGWISPALGTARSTASNSGSPRPRGLQVAVLNDEKKELILGDVPHQTVSPKTPGLGSGSVGMHREKAQSHDPAGSATTQRREIILCRYFHTPGLTCTSRPCRFVHALDSLGLGSTVEPPSTAPVTFKVLSPHHPDPTEGTFAQAQSLKPPRSTWRNSMPASGLNGLTGTTGIDRTSLLSPTIPALNAKAEVAAETPAQAIGSVFGGMEPGQRVILTTDDGELNGTVFLMSGGGKGAVGKSKAKYKTVPCKDYAEGYCPYGDYCSFIHQKEDTEPSSSVTMSKTKSADILSSLAEPSADDDAVTPPSTPGSSRRRRYSTGSYATTTLVGPKFEPTVPAIPDARSDSSHTSQDGSKSPDRNHSEQVEAGQSMQPASTQGLPTRHRAWLDALPQSILVTSVKIDPGQFEKLRPALSAFAPPFQQRSVVVGSDGDLSQADDVSDHLGASQVLRQTQNKRTESTTTSSAWARGPPPSLKSLTLKKISNPHLSGKLVPPTSAISMYGTESDPATPWDPALRQQQINAMRQTAWNPSLPSPSETPEQWPLVAQANPPPEKGDQGHSRLQDSTEPTLIHPEYAGSLFVPPTPLATPLHPPMVPPYYPGAQYADHIQAWPYSPFEPTRTPQNVTEDGRVQPPWYPPPPVMYPWGMPMSPVLPPQPVEEGPKAQVQGKDNTRRTRNHRRGMSTPADLLKLPGGLGVMWTPAGWAVQDAAMKLDLKLAEMKLAGESAEGTKEKKSYYKSRQCIFFSQGYCPHGDQCSYRHDPPSRTSSPSDPSTELMTPAAIPASSNGSPTKRKPIPILPCKFYNSASGCSRGSECTFLHAMVVPQSVPLVDRPRPWRTKQCRHWLVGRCTLGDACHFAHVDANGNDEHANPTGKGAGPGSTPGPASEGYGKYSPYDLAGYGLVNGSAGNGWGGYAAEVPLSEDKVRMAMRDIKRYTAKEESDDEDDDLEIVTEDTSATPQSSHVAFSPTRQWGRY